MLPLFKSHYSIGKSILRLDLDSFKSDSESNIFSILLKHKITNLVLVEDTMTGFLEAYKNATELSINLIFGLRISLHSGDVNDSHKAILFAKSPEGFQRLNKIFTYYNLDHNNCIDYKTLKSNWLPEDLNMAIPFYDSFIFENFLNFKNCIPDFSFCDPIFFTENNMLPFDVIVNELIAEYCSKNNYKTISTKSIFYNKKSDFNAYQTYKCICNRSFSKNGRTLENPNLDHCASDQFSFESYLENESS